MYITTDVDCSARAPVLVSISTQNSVLTLAEGASTSDERQAGRLHDMTESTFNAGHRLNDWSSTNECSDLDRTCVVGGIQKCTMRY